MRKRKNAFKDTSRQLAANLSSNDEIKQQIRQNLYRNPYANIWRKCLTRLSKDLIECSRLKLGGSLLVECAPGFFNTALATIRNCIEANAAADAKVLHIDGRMKTSAVLKTIAHSLDTILNLDDDESNFESTKTRISVKEGLAVLMSHLKKEAMQHTFIFVLEHFHLFVRQHTQAILYSLLDSAQHENKLKIYVIGITQAYDSIEGLEKRVRSRLEQRRIFLAPNDYCQTIEDLKKILIDKLTIDGLSDWNRSITDVFNTEKGYNCLCTIYNDTISIERINQYAMNIFDVAMMRNSEMRDLTFDEDMLNEAHIKTYCYNSQYYEIQGMGLYKVCLMLAARDMVQIAASTNSTSPPTFTFEALRTRYLNVLNAARNHFLKCDDREVLYLAFEELLDAGLITEQANSARAKTQKFYRQCQLEINEWELEDTLKSLANSMQLPTLVETWIVKRI